MENQVVLSSGQQSLLNHLQRNLTGFSPVAKNILTLVILNILIKDLDVLLRHSTDQTYEDSANIKEALIYIREYIKRNIYEINLDIIKLAMQYLK